MLKASQPIETFQWETLNVKTFAWRWDVKSDPDGLTGLLKPQEVNITKYCICDERVHVIMSLQVKRGCTCLIGQHQVQLCYWTPSSSNEWVWQLFPVSWVPFWLITGLFVEALWWHAQLHVNVFIRPLQHRDDHLSETLCDFTFCPYSTNVTESTENARQR